MKKQLFVLIGFVVTLLLLSTLASCGTTAYQPLHDDSEIEKILIVDYDPERVSELRPNQKTLDALDVLCTIDSSDGIGQFMSEFSKLECTYVYTDPMRLLSKQTCIVFMYDNGDYSILGASGETRYKLGYEHSSTGRFAFDEKQFDAFVEQYIDSAPSN